MPFFGDLELPTRARRRDCDRRHEPASSALEGKQRPGRQGSDLSVVRVVRVYLHHDVGLCAGNEHLTCTLMGNGCVTQRAPSDASPATAGVGGGQWAVKSLR